MEVTKSTNVTTAEKNLVVKYVKKCLRELAKRDYEIVDAWGKPVTVAMLQKHAHTFVKCRGQASRAGAHKITVDVAAYRLGYTHFAEYRAVAKDQTIGTIPKADKETVLLALVAHEVAHHIQYRYGGYTRWLMNNYRKPHGHGWQAIYRILRANVVNPNIPQ